MNVSFLTKTFAAVMLLALFSCNKDNIAEPVDPAETQYINARSFTDFASSHNLTVEDFVFSEEDQDLILQGHKAQFDLYVFPEEANEGKSKIVAIPFIDSDDFTHLVAFDIAEGSPERLGNFHLSGSEYGFAKLFLHDQFVQGYRESTSAKNISLVITGKDSNDQTDKSCETVIISLEHVITRPSGLQSVISYDREMIISCTNDVPSTPSNTTVTVTGGGVTNFNNVAARSNLFPDPNGWLRCSSWNFQVEDNSTGLVRDVNATTQLTNGSITVPVFDQASNGPVEKTVPFHAYVSVPLAAGTDPNGQGFKRCVTYAYQFAVADVRASLAPASNFFTIPDHGIASTVGVYFATNLDSKGCIYSPTQTSTVTSAFGPSGASNNTTVSPASYGTWFNYSSDCGY